MAEPSSHDGRKSINNQSNKNSTDPQALSRRRLLNVSSVFSMVSSRSKESCRKQLPQAIINSTHHKPNFQERPPSRRVDMGDDEPAHHSRPTIKSTSITKPSQKQSTFPLSSQESLRGFNISMNEANKGFRLSRNPSGRSFASHSTADELEYWSGQNLSVSSIASRPSAPVPTLKGFSVARRDSRRSMSDRSFASHSTRDEIEHLTGQRSLAESVVSDRTPPPPFLMRTTTQSSVQRLERHSSYGSSSAGIIMTTCCISSRPGNPMATVLKSDQSGASFGDLTTAMGWTPAASSSAAQCSDVPLLSELCFEIAAELDGWAPAGHSFQPFRRASM
jgi:hypothetical protein